jgi:hypothetical protein
MFEALADKPDTVRFEAFNDHEEHATECTARQPRFKLATPVVPR